MEPTIVACITGVVTLIGVILSNSKSRAVMEVTLDALTEKVEKHNQVLERTYRLEQDMAVELACRNSGLLQERGRRSRRERFERDVEVAYVAHDVSRLIRFKDGHAEEIGSIPFTFRFMTFYDLLEEAGGIDYVSEQTDLFDELVHHGISRLPDSYSLKQRYSKIISKKD